MSTETGLTADELDAYRREVSRIVAERDVLRAAIAHVIEMAKKVLADYELERMNGVEVPGFADELDAEAVINVLSTALAVPETPGAKDDEPCGEEREEYGRVMTCTRPKGHAAHIAYKHGTAWTYLRDDGEADLAPETPGDAETEDRS